MALHICILTAEYPTEAYRAGGMGRAMGKIAAWLADAGHRVSVCVAGSHNMQFQERKDIRVHRYRIRPLLPKWVRRVVAWPTPVALYEAGMTVRAVLDELDAIEPVDVVLSSNSPSDLLAAASNRWPWVTRISSYWSFCAACNFEPPFIGALRGNLHAWMQDAAIVSSTIAYAPSRIVARVFERRTRRVIEVLKTPMHVPEQPPRWPEVAEKYGLPENFLLFYGSHQGVKGPHILAAALPTILDSAPDLHAVFIGRDRNAPCGAGGMIQYLKRYLASYSARVHFSGILEQAEAFAVLKQAQLVVLPSLLDNLPNTLLEALYFGRLVVGTRASGLDEILEHNQNGVLVARNDPNALRKGILQALAFTPEKKKALCAEGKKRVRHDCAPERVGAELEEMLQRAIQNHRQKRGLFSRLNLALVQTNYWLKVLHLWLRGVSIRELDAFHQLAEAFLPDYDRQTGRVRNPVVPGEGNIL